MIQKEANFVSLTHWCTNETSNKSTDHLKARIFQQALNADRWAIPSLTHNLLLYPPPPPFSVLHLLVSKIKPLLICHLGAPPSLLFVLCYTDVNREYVRWGVGWGGEKCFRRKSTLNCAPCSPSLFREGTCTIFYLFDSHLIACHVSSSVSGTKKK